MPDIVNNEVIFIGLGHELFYFNRIWIIRHHGKRYLIGKNGDHDEADAALLSSCLALESKEQAWLKLLDKLKLGGTEYLQDGVDVQDIPLDWTFRSNIPRVWTVNFDENVIFLDRPDCHLLHQMSIPESRPLDIYHLQAYCPPEADPDWKAPEDFPLWEPEIVVPEPLFNLVYHLVSDYYRTFHKEVSNSNGESGFQALALGLLACFTLNFSIERTLSDQKPTSLGVKSSWRKFAMPPVILTVEFEHAVIMFTQNMAQTDKLFQLHYDEECAEALQYGRSVLEKTYIVTSLYQVRFTRRSGQGWKQSRVHSLFHSESSPEQHGVLLMLNAIQQPYYPLLTRLHRLPVELQEEIIISTSWSEIGRAYYGGILNIGLPFKWKKQCKSSRQNMPFKLVERSVRRNYYHVESDHQVIIFNTYCGLTYAVEPMEPT